MGATAFLMYIYLVTVGIFSLVV